MKTKNRNLLIAFAVTMLFCLTANAQWIRWQPAAGGNGHWYKAVINTNLINWTQADRIARSHGGYLATITSHAENSFVFSLINSSTYFQGVGRNGAGPAIGGFQPNGSVEPSGGWAWITSETWNYSNWSPATNGWAENPDNNHCGQSFNCENRIHFFSGADGIPAATWNDISDSDPNIGGYVMESDDDPENPRLDIRVSQVELRWQSATNTWYQIQYRSVLSTNQWMPLATNWVAGDGTKQYTNDTIFGGSPQRLYRLSIRTSPPQ